MFAGESLLFLQIAILEVYCLIFGQTGAKPFIRLSHCFFFFFF